MKNANQEYLMQVFENLESATVDVVTTPTDVGLCYKVASMIARVQDQLLEMQYDYEL